MKEYTKIQTSCPDFPDEPIRYCEDVISRQAVLGKAVYTETEEGWSGRTVDVKDIEALPPVTPKLKTDVLDKIRSEIEGNMESIIGKYDSSIPKFNMPSYKIERNKAREECISIIDKYKAESEGQ